MRMKNRRWKRNLGEIEIVIIVCGRIWGGNLFVFNSPYSAAKEAIPSRSGGAMILIFMEDGAREVSDYNPSNTP